MRWGGISLNLAVKGVDDMAVRFRLRGLAETFIEQIHCPGCGLTSGDDADFGTELTRVTLEGIVVVLQCRKCSEVFVPINQRLGIIDRPKLKLAVEQDSKETGEPLFESYSAVRLNAERHNAQRKGDLH